MYFPGSQSHSPDDRNYQWEGQNSLCDRYFSLGINPIVKSCGCCTSGAGGELAALHPRTVAIKPVRVPCFGAWPPGALQSRWVVGDVGGRFVKGRVYLYGCLDSVSFGLILIGRGRKRKRFLLTNESMRY